MDSRKEDVLNNSQELVSINQIQPKSKKFLPSVYRSNQVLKKPDKQAGDTLRLSQSKSSTIDVYNSRKSLFNRDVKQNFAKDP